MGIFGQIAKWILIIAVLGIIGNFILAIFTDIPGFSLTTFKSLLASLTPYFSWIYGFLAQYVPMGFLLFLTQVWWFIVFPLGLTIRFLLFIAGVVLS